MLQKTIQYCDNKLKIGFERNHNWFTTISALTFFGGAIIPSIFNNAFLQNSGTHTQMFVMSMSYLTIAFLYGLITGILTVLSLRLILNYMKIRITYHDLFKLFRIAYMPYSLVVLIYLIQIAYVNYLDPSFAQDNIILLTIFYFLLLTPKALVAVISLVIFYRGMNRLTGLKLYQNILINLIVGIIVSPINILLIYY